MRFKLTYLKIDFKIFYIFKKAKSKSAIIVIPALKGTIMKNFKPNTLLPIQSKGSIVIIPALKG